MVTGLRPGVDEVGLTSTGYATVNVPARFAWAPVGGATAALAALLTATSGGYGYFRDELYFRMLPPQWAYLDQPPLTPWLVRVTSLVADEVWAVRIPATLAAVCAVLLVALVTRELGGRAFAQGLAAWGYGFGSLPLAFGHTAITEGWDLVAWLAASLFVVRAVLRREPRWWLAAGGVVGLATWNKLLIPLLVVSLAVGLALDGPRRLPWRYICAGLAVALVIALPQIAYQATHDLPQLTMARALTEGAGSDNRVWLVPFLIIMIGPVLVPVWAAGLFELRRRPTWRPVRFLSVAFVVTCGSTLLVGGAPYYVLGLVSVVYAAGCVPVSEWVIGSASRRRMVLRAVTANAIVATLVALPVLPLSWVGSTPVMAVNDGARGSVGWPDYVAQVTAAYNTLAPDDRAEAIVVASTFGEAGAIARYGSSLGLRAVVVSGHNELAVTTTPPDQPVPAVVIGLQALQVATRIATCTEVARLDNRLAINTPEQGQPIAVCQHPRESWLAAWPQFRHVG